MRKNQKMSQGITLIALVVTIIVLLILAGITVAMLTGENGILLRTKDAKENSEIAKEKEIVETSTIQAMEQNKFGVLKQSELQSKLNDYANIDERIDVMEDGENLIVYFSQSNRYYQVNSNGDVENFIVYKDSTPGELAGSGNENDPFKIECIEDLVVFSMMTNEGNADLNIPSNISFNNKYVIMTRSLDFESIFSYNDFSTTKFGDLNNDGIVENIKEELNNKNKAGIGFTPIGEKRQFNGIFDGNNYEIKNIYEYAINSKELGLFSNVSTCIIKNLTISGLYEMPEENPTAFYNCSAGGIVAKVNGGKVNIINCKNKINIKSKGYGVAGIIGRSFANNTQIINCGNTGNIENYNGEGAAGIIGRCEHSAEFYNAYNTGNIIASSFGGGIIGYFCAQSTDMLDMINIYNIGQIKKCNWGNGGIIGGNGCKGVLNIKNAYNIGTIEEVVGKSGAILGCIRNEPSELNILNCFYVRTSNETAVVGKNDNLYGVTLSEMIENETIKNTFNRYIENNPDNMELTEWKKWTIKENILEFE